MRSYVFTTNLNYQVDLICSLNSEVQAIHFAKKQPFSHLSNYRDFGVSHFICTSKNFTDLCITKYGKAGLNINWSSLIQGAILFCSLHVNVDVPCDL